MVNTAKLHFMRTLFLGDSHLALLRRHHLAWLEQELGARIENAAFDGAWSGDLRKQIGDRDLRLFDAVLLSIGTNDTHPASKSSPETLHANLADVLAGAPRTILLLSPGVHQAPAPFDTDEVNAMIRGYADIAAQTVTARGGGIIPTLWLLDELGPKAWAPDGVHFSTEAYDRLIPTLARALGPH